MLDLKPLKVSDSKFLLRTPWRGRIILFGIALILASIMVVNVRFSLAPGLLALIAVLAGFYTEQWLFDLDRQVVIHTEGLLFLKRKRSITLEEVERVQLRNSRPGGSASRIDYGPEAPSFSPSPSDRALTQDPPKRYRGRGFSGLFLILVNGREVNLHTTAIRKAPEQAELGRVIAQFCGKPFSTN
jgi:hypothetical protein